jgi:hypothetical protein
MHRAAEVTLLGVTWMLCGAQRLNGVLKNWPAGAKSPPQALKCGYIVKDQRGFSGTKIKLPALSHQMRQGAGTEHPRVIRVGQPHVR